MPTEEELKKQKEEETKKQSEEKNPYIEEIKKLKETYVPKEELEKAKSENKQLLDAIINGNGSEKKEEKVKKATQKDIDETSKKLFDPDADLSNLEYAKLAVKYRKEVIDVYGEKADPFVSHKHNSVADESEYEKARNVAAALEDAIEKSDGDSGVFTSELQRVMVEPDFIRLAQKRKK